MNRSTNNKVLDRRLALFGCHNNNELLCCNLRGIEREALRVTASREMSGRHHPPELGSALTHPFITTDFAEPLLEFITEPFPTVDDLLRQLGDIHSFAASQMQEELLWPCSMPCRLGNDAGIPLAQYGSSNMGKMKTIYRRGLGHRYGRKMQTIAGIHFNFSVPDAVWSKMRADDLSLLTLQDYRTRGYMGLVRNFRRRFWLLLYLMGASPVVDRSFVSGRKHNLQELGENDLYLPYATSLRMGDLGYQSSAQNELYVCYNSVETYVETLLAAITEEYPAYGNISGESDTGEPEQLSTAILQIENEFYSTIRPKQTTRAGETQLKALMERGVEYIEVRCVDINPFDPLGISREQVLFLELFLLGCLFDISQDTDEAEYRETLHNQNLLVTRGREPGLKLTSGGAARTLKAWANEILNQLEPVSRIMDNLDGGHSYSQALAVMSNRLEDGSLCPSAVMLESMQTKGQSFVEWSDAQARTHAESYRQGANPEVLDHFRQLAAQSLREQARIETVETETLDVFMQSYFAQYQQI